MSDGQGSALTWGFYMGFTDNYTGAQRAIVNLLSQINRQLIDPVLISQRESPMTDDARKLDLKIEICPLPESLECRQEAALKESIFKKLTNARRIRRYNRDIMQILHARRIKGLWVRNIRGVLLTGHAAKRLKIPLIWDIGLEKEVKGLLKSYLFHRALSMADRVVTQARNVQVQVFPEAMRRRFQNKFSVIRTGIRPERIAEIESGVRSGVRGKGKFKIVCPATINDRKNQLMLVQAVALLRDRKENLVVDLVGPATDDRYLELVKQSIEQSRLTEVVRLLGWRDDIPDLMGDADLMVLCSKNEGVPQSILEAFHSGLPVIGTRAGGIPDVIEHDRTGWLIDVGNIQQLASQIEKCMASESSRVTVAEQAKQFVRQNHTVENWCREYEKLICELGNHPGFPVLDQEPLRNAQ